MSVLFCLPSHLRNFPTSITIVVNHPFQNLNVNVCHWCPQEKVARFTLEAVLMDVEQSAFHHDNTPYVEPHLEYPIFQARALLEGVTLPIVLPTRPSTSETTYDR